MKWLVVVLVAFLYIHLFNALARIPNLTLSGLWSRFFPPITIVVGA
jgi:flagellar biosynthesis protein FliQ